MTLVPMKETKPEHAAHQMHGEHAVHDANGMAMPNHDHGDHDHGHEMEMHSSINLVDPAYFPALRIPLLQGRLWSDTENQNGAHVAVINQTLARAYFRGQWRKMHAFEAGECRHYDHVVVVSPEDRDLVSREYGVHSVSDVPTGVDTSYFCPTGTLPRDPHSMVFTGAMDWIPNDDAIRFCVQQILPRIRQAVPDATLTVVGRNPSPALVALSARVPGVTVTGRVEDVRPYMERAALYVVPLRIGGGTRLKIFEAMAMGLPVVSMA